MNAKVIFILLFGSLLQIIKTEQPTTKSMDTQSTAHLITELTNKQLNEASSEKPTENPNKQLPQLPIDVGEQLVKHLLKLTEIQRIKLLLNNPNITRALYRHRLKRMGDRPCPSFANTSKIDKLMNRRWYAIAISDPKKPATSQCQFIQDYAVDNVNALEVLSFRQATTSYPVNIYSIRQLLEADGELYTAVPDLVQWKLTYFVGNYASKVGMLYCCNLNNRDRSKWGIYSSRPTITDQEMNELKVILRANGLSDKLYRYHQGKDCKYDYHW